MRTLIYILFVVLVLNVGWNLRQQTEIRNLRYRVEVEPTEKFIYHVYPKKKKTYTPLEIVTYP